MDPMLRISDAEHQTRLAFKEYEEMLKKRWTRIQRDAIIRDMMRAKHANQLLNELMQDSQPASEVMK